MFFNRTPHPYEYDYDYNEISDNTINIHTLLCLFMKNFIPNYSFPREVQCLPMKYLKIFLGFVIVYKIDNYYIKFKEQSSVNTITSMSILSPFSVPRKTSSTTVLSPKCDTIEVTAKDTKGSVYNSSMSINQNHQCSILRKPSYANKLKHRSEVIPASNSNNNPMNNNNNNISVMESSNGNNNNNNNTGDSSVVKPIIDTTTTTTTTTATQSLNNNNNNINISKSNSADSYSPFILNVESRDNSPIYHLTPPNILPPCYSSSSSGTNNNNKNNNMKSNLRPVSTSLNTIQISHSNSNGTLPPTYPLRPLASSCDENRFSNNYNKKIKNNNNILERSSSSGSVTIPGFIYPSSNEDNFDDNCMDMQV